MCCSMRSLWLGKIIMVTLAVTFVLSLFVLPGMVAAKRDDGRNRSEFYGIVEERPANGFQGQWVIGGRVVTSDAGTEFDESDGPLAVGGCAKVKIRYDRVHEIESEPMRDCLKK